MAASAMVLSLATDKSLILIDELGRGTSPEEGIGISHAIAEELIHRKVGHVYRIVAEYASADSDWSSKAFVLFATHYQDLSTTLSRYPSVINLHLAVQNNSRANGFKLKFQYRLLDGFSDTVPHYGLEPARLADLPPDVLTEAKRVAERLSEMEAERREASKSTKIQTRRKAMLSLKTQLTQALDHSKLPDDALAAYLLTLQKEIVNVLTDTAEEPEDG
ncbi:MutS protein msh4 [Tulasnella sp. 427]|nr:MutS protein msh4 [Tulasnella sp. 427]